MNPLSNYRGFLLVGILIAAVISGIVMLAVISLGSLSGKQQLQSNSAFQVSLISQNFVTTLENRVSWTSTLANNATSFYCLLNPATCSNVPGAAVPGLPFQADDVTGQPIGCGWPTKPYNSAANGGFTSSGQVCTGFNAAPGPGSDLCPFKLTLTWTALCSATPCNQANLSQIQVNGVWSYNPASQKRQIAFNSQNYNFQVVLNVSLGASPPLTTATCNLF